MCVSACQRVKEPKSSHIKIQPYHSVQGYTFIEENFPGLFTADTGLPQALDDIKSKKNQFQRSKNFT